MASLLLRYYKIIHMHFVYDFILGDTQSAYGLYFSVFLEETPVFSGGLYPVLGFKLGWW